MRLYLDGQCPECGRIIYKRINATIDEDQLQSSKCPYCKSGIVEYERLHVHHPIEDIVDKVRQNKRIFMILLIAVIAAAVAMVAYLEVRTHRKVGMEELSAARKAASEMSCSGILEELSDKAPGGTKSVAKLIKSENSVICRLMRNESVPSQSMDIAVRHLYAEYKVLGGSWVSLWWRYRNGRFDPYTGAINNLQETSLVY